MDGHRFDALVRALNAGTPRRRVLRGLLGGAVAGGAAAVTEPAVGAWLAGTGVLCAGVGWSMARTRRLRLRALVRQGLANFLDWLGQ